MDNLTTNWMILIIRKVLKKLNLYGKHMHIQIVKDLILAIRLKKFLNIMLRVV